MNKDEEIKHLTALNERNHSQIIALKESCRLLDAKVSERNAVVEDLSRQLRATREKWNEDKAALSACRNAVKVGATQRARVDNQNLELQNMLYGVIGMLSEQNAETVLSQLDKLQRATKGW